jgi:ABC-type anion transport system duplicated permease subunit
MSEDKSFEIVATVCAIIWFVGSVASCIYIKTKKRGSEDFTTAFMAIFCSPVAILPMALGFFALVLIFFCHYLPSKLYGEKDF